MKTSNDLFSRTSKIYENASSSCLKRHEIEFPPAAKIIQASSRLFQILDRSDSHQTEISRRLWVLRSSILFTALPFSDPALRLLEQAKELDQLSRVLPDSAQLIETLIKCVSEIVDIGQNPKREWLLRTLNEETEANEGRVGVLSALSAGRPPGWPTERSNDLLALSGRIVPIRSKRDLVSTLFNQVILPCACRNTPFSLLSALLYSGVTARIDVLLYPGEKFQIPRRLILPGDQIFNQRLQKTEVEYETVSIAGDPSLSAVDTWMNEAFWQGLHGGSRNGTPGFSPANYMLFSNGTGTFLPENGRVLTIKTDGAVTDESDLCTVPVEDICEGDLVILRSGDSGFLLDDASDRIMNGMGNERLFEMATDWKVPLEALLVTHSYEEVAEKLRERGVASSALSIHQWVGPDVLGPGDERVFRELINLLADKGKIKKSDQELIGYTESRWNCLKELRGVRHKAGNQIRRDLFKALFSRISAGNKELADGECIHIEGDTGAELLILRVSSVDYNTAYVAPARLGRMDNHKENKWLG